MEITYTKVGDYLIPDLTLPPEKEHKTNGGYWCPVNNSAKGMCSLVMTMLWLGTICKK